MDFTIYTLSPPSFLEAALNGLAIMTGGGDFKTMIMIGLLLGVLFTYFKSIFNGAEKVGVGEIFIAFLIYLLAFAPTARVTIENIKDGEVRVVDNVPLGVAVTGSIISTIGKGTLTIMQDAYDPVNRMGNFSYVEPLRVLQVARQGTSTPKFWDAVNSYAQSAGYPNADIHKSFVDYISDCTTTALQLDPKTTGYKKPTDIPNKPINEAIKFQSNVYYTRVTLYGDDRDNMTCSNAFDTLWGIIRGSMDASPAPGLNNPTTYLTNLASDILLKEMTDYTQTLSDVIQGFGWTYDDARYFMINNALKPVIAEGFSAEFNYSGNTNAAIMLSTALAQRDTQWAAEYTMFTESMDAIIAFVETFLYAVTPILAFLMVMGGFGMKLAPKYMLMAFWVWLWYPILSIVNLYLTNSVEASLSHIGPTLSSMYASQELDAQIQHWVAVAGLMGAITPILALTILTGSAYAMTTLAQRLGGRDHVDEKQVTPDVRTAAPALATTASYTATPFSTGVTNASMPSIDWSNTTGAVYQSAHQKSVQAQRQWQDTLTNTVTSASESQDAVQRMAAFGNIVSSAHGRAVEATKSITAGLAKAFKISNENSKALSGAVSAHLSGGLSLPRLASIIGKLSGNKGAQISAQDVASTLDELKRNTGFNEKMQAQFQDQVQAQLSDSKNKTDIERFAESDAQKLQKASSEARTWNKIESAARSVSNSAGISQSLPLDQFTKIALGNRNAKSQLDEYYAKSSLSEQSLLDRSIATYSNMFGPGLGRYMAIAQYALQKAANGDGRAIEAVMPAVDAYGQQSIGQTGVSIAKGKSVTAEVNQESTRGEVKLDAENLTETPTNSKLDQDRPKGPPPHSDATNQVNQDYKNHAQGVTQQAERNMGKQAGKVLQETLDKFTQNADGSPTPVEGTSLALSALTKLSKQEPLVGTKAAWDAAAGIAKTMLNAGQNWSQLSDEQRQEYLEQYRRNHPDQVGDQSTWEKAKNIYLGAFAGAADLVQSRIAGYEAMSQAFASGDVDKMKEAAGHFLSWPNMSFEEKGQAIQAMAASQGLMGTDHVKLAQDVYEATLNQYRVQAADAFTGKGFTRAQAEYMAARMYATDEGQVQAARKNVEEEFIRQNGVGASGATVEGYIKMMDQAVAHGGMDPDNTAATKEGNLIKKYNTYRNPKQALQ